MMTHNVIKTVLDIATIRLISTQLKLKLDSSLFKKTVAERLKEIQWSMNCMDTKNTVKRT